MPVFIWLQYSKKARNLTMLKHVLQDMQVHKMQTKSVQTTSTTNLRVWRFQKKLKWIYYKCIQVV